MSLISIVVIVRGEAEKRDIYQFAAVPRIGEWVDIRDGRNLLVEHIEHVAASSEKHMLLALIRCYCSPV